jgi:hypothetical protein
VIRFDGTKQPLTNASEFSFRHLFVVAKYSAAVFPDYKGLVTGLTGWGGLIGNIGDTKFHPLSTLFPGVNWAARVNGEPVDPDAIPGPMNTFKLVQISASSSVPMDGLSVGQDRHFTSRRWNGDVAEIIVLENSILESDIWEVEEYLMRKWGL